MGSGEWGAEPVFSGKHYYDDHDGTRIGRMSRINTDFENSRISWFLEGEPERGPNP